MMLIGQTLVEPGEDFGEPFAIILGSILFGLLANICYTLGWLVELMRVRGDAESHSDFRRRAFTLGLALSCALATAPIWPALLVWTWRSFYSG